MFTGGNFLMNSLKPAAVGIMICICLILSGCSPAQFVTNPSQKPVPLDGTETVPTETQAPEIIRELTRVVTAEELLELEKLTELERLDLSGSTCYRAIEAFCKEHPQIDVTYTVSMGRLTIDSQAEQISVQPGEADYQSLMDNLRYLHNLTSLYLVRTDLTVSELDALIQEYPELDIQYSLEVFDQEYPADITELDLSFLSSEQVEEACQAVSRFPGLTYVELTDANGKSKLSKADVKALSQAAPDTVFHYRFTLFGKEISTTDETIEYQNLNLGNDRADEIREALDILTGCKTFILDNCGIDYEVLDQIRSEYDRTDLVWRVQFGKYSAMTNTDTIRAVYNVFDNTCYNLRYCRDVKYMDIGHNEDLTDLSFVGYMPKLEILIASQTNVTDLSGFENCKNLEFLELAFCMKLSDLTPLSGCSNLKNLNICYTKVSSLMPLDGLPLERLSCKQTRVPAKEQTLFKELHPDCLAMFAGKEPYAGAGWRYVDNGKTYTEIYKKVREVFDYDTLDKNMRSSG